MRLGQTIGNDGVHRRIKSQSDMGAGHWEIAFCVLGPAIPPIHDSVIGRVHRSFVHRWRHVALQVIHKIAGAVPGVAIREHGRPVLFQDAEANRFGCEQDGRMSHGTAEGRPQRSDRSNVLWPLCRDRAGNNASQAVADQMDFAAGFGKRLLNGLIQPALNQQVRTLCVQTDAGKEGPVSDPPQPFMQEE